MKRKRVVGILAVIVVLMIGATSVLAADTNNRKNYVDSDYDGVCDNYESNKVPGEETCLDYADTDGNGVCDNYAERQEDGQGRKGCVGRGVGHHSRQRNGRCGVNKR